MSIWGKGGGKHGKVVEKTLYKCCVEYWKLPVGALSCLYCMWNFALATAWKLFSFFRLSTSTKFSSFSPIARVKRSIPRLVWKPLISRLVRKTFLSPYKISDIKVVHKSSLSFSSENRPIAQTRRLDYLTRRALTDWDTSWLLARQRESNFHLEACDNAAQHCQSKIS